MKVFTDRELLKDDGGISAYVHDEKCNCELHRHEYFEIEFILSGSGTYEVDNISYPLAPDMFFLTTPASFHFLNTSEPFKLINVSFTFDVFSDLNVNELIEQGAPVGLKLLGDDRQVIHTLLKEMVFAQREHNKAYKKTLLACLLQKFAKVSPPYSPTGNSHIRKALIYILGNLGSEITLESVAKHLGISPVYFCTYFKDTMGISFKSYLDNIRFNHSAKLLKSTDMSIAEIAHSAGFKDYANFMRRFKTKYGATPNEYRNNDYRPSR